MPTEFQSSCRASCANEEETGSGVNANSRFGGRSAEVKGWGLGKEQCPLPENFFISKWHILVNSDVLNLKYVIILGDILIDVPPNQHIGSDVSPESPAGLTPVETGSLRWSWFSSSLFISPLRRHIFVCFMAKSAFYRP